MIVVAIIGLLAGLCIPAYLKSQVRSQNSSVANGFRVFSQAFETYATNNGSWPGNVGPGAVPPGMNNDIKVSTWQAVTPIGGQWNWDYFPTRTFGYLAGISISNFTCSAQQLQDIDAMIDDGNLSTGNVQLTQSNRLTFILEQ